MKPIAFFDLETTGTDTAKDRIVSIAVVKVQPTLLQVLDKKEAFINPTIPIPPGATDVHGITNEMVADKPTFSAYAKSLFELLKECDMAGYNILNFDVPLLAAEFERCGIVWPLPGTHFIDSYIIFAEKEKRDLSAAVRFYTGKDHEGAHGALADVMGTLGVLAGQINRYEDLQGLDTAGLHAACMGNRVDLAGKIVKDDQGVPVYGFGKDKGKRIKENQGFALWMLKQDFPAETKRAINSILGYK